MAGPLRTALENWAADKFQPEGGPGWFDRVKARWNEFKALWVRAEQNNKRMSFLLSFNLTQDMIMYAITGAPGYLSGVKLLAGITNPDPSQDLAALLRDAATTPAIQEIVQIFGTLATEPILALFEEQIKNPSQDPKEFARTFHGIMVSLNAFGAISDTLAQTLSVGAIKSVGTMMQSMYWSLGLGFLGWQTLAPLLSSGLQPGLERYYRNMARPSRFSAGELRDLHALGILTTEQLRSEARDLGWREQDIDQWIKLAFRTLGQGEIFDAYHQGKMTQEQAVTRLRALGYDPKDIPLLFELNPPPDEKQDIEVAATTARQAFREGLVSEAELTALLSAAGKSAREIALIIQIEKTKTVTDNRALTVSQLKAAWQENVITTPEAAHWLATYGFEQTESQIILDTWQAEITPEFRKLNLATIIGAYVEGILNRATTREKLIAIGLAGEDADLEIKLAEARNPEAFGQLPKPAQRNLTVSMLADILAAGLITPDEMQTRLSTLGYTPEDAALIVKSISVSQTPGARELPQRSIERAYVAGALNADQTRQQLSLIRFGPEQIEIILTTLDKEIALLADQPESEKAKTLTPGTLEDLVIAGLMTPGEMRTRLLASGYTEDDAELLSDRAAQLAQPIRRALNQPMIERAYLAGVLNRQRAYDRLLELEFTPEDAENILLTVERENPDAFSPGLVQSLRLPSVDALSRAVQNGIITFEEFLARMVEAGFSLDDAAMYLTLAIKQERKSTKQLSASQVVNAYGAGFVPWAAALTRLNTQGYGNQDAVLLLRMEKDQIQNTDVWNSLLAGELDPFSAIGQLISERYSDEDIYLAFASLTPTTLSEMGIDLQTLKATLAEIAGGV